MGDTLMPGILLVNGIESDNEDLEFDCIGDGKNIKFKRDGVEVASIGDGGFVGAGKILQVVQAETSIVYSTTSDAWQDIFSATITPTKTTSDILVSYHLLISAAQQDYCDIRLLQEGSQIGSSNAAYGVITYMGPNDDPHFYSQNPMTQQLKVSPNTTAPITFKLQFNRGSNTGTAYINRSGGNAAASSTSTITLMEIGA